MLGNHARWRRGPEYHCHFPSWLPKLLSTTGVCTIPEAMHGSIDRTEAIVDAGSPCLKVGPELFP